MKVGEVVQIRVNPRDCMGVADVVRQLNLHIQGMSFAQAVSITLTALLETVRSAGKIPSRDGWEYGEVMAPFAFKKRSARKLEITKAFELTNPVGILPSEPIPELPIEARRLQSRLRELEWKRDADPGNFSEAEQRELAWTLEALAESINSSITRNASC